MKYKHVALCLCVSPVLGKKADYGQGTIEYKDLAESPDGPVIIKSLKDCQDAKKFCKRDSIK